MELEESFYEFYIFKIKIKRLVCYANYIRVVAYFELKIRFEVIIQIRYNKIQYIITKYKCFGRQSLLQ